MLARLVLAVVVGIVVTLACVFVGGLLINNSLIGWVVDIGSFLKTYGGLLGLLAALWYFFANTSTWPWHRA